MTDFQRETKNFVLVSLVYAAKNWQKVEKFGDISFYPIFVGMEQKKKRRVQVVKSSEHSIYELRYERIGRAVATELSRNRHFRREVERLALGSRILKMYDDGLGTKDHQKRVGFFSFLFNLFNRKTKTNEN